MEDIYYKLDIPFCEEDFGTFRHVIICEGVINVEYTPVKWVCFGRDGVLVETDVNFILVKWWSVWTSMSDKTKDKILHSRKIDGKDLFRKKYEVGKEESIKWVKENRRHYDWRKDEECVKRLKSLFDSRGWNSQGLSSMKKKTDTSANEEDVDNIIW